MKSVIAFASVVVASGLLYTNLYTSLVDAKSWGGDIPGSIDTARNYFKASNPGNFFRIFSPVNQVLALLVVIFTWKQFPGLKMYTISTLLLYVGTDIFTFAYFYPRNDILFKNSALTDIELLKSTLIQWKNANWLRSLTLVAGIIISFFILKETMTRNAR